MKKLKIVVMMMFVTLLMTGCGSNDTSIVFDVETGDKIKVTLDESDNYQLIDDIPFVVSQDDEELSKGTFMNENGYNQYKELVENNEDVNILDEESNSNIEYIFFEYESYTSEYNYIIMIKDSNTGIVLKNTVSQDSAEEVFSRLSFARD